MMTLPIQLAQLMRTLSVPVAEASTRVASGDTLKIPLAPAGGYAAAMTPVK